jgi:hypothetical protein
MTNKNLNQVDGVLGELLVIFDDERKIEKFSFADFNLNKIDIYFLALRFQYGFGVKKNLLIAKNCYEYVHYNYDAPFNFGEYNYEVIESPDYGASLLSHLLVLFELKNSNHFIDDDGVDWFNDECLTLLASASLIYNQIWPLGYLKAIKPIVPFNNKNDAESYLIINNVVDAFNNLLKLALENCESLKFIKK